MSNQEFILLLKDFLSKLEGGKQTPSEIVRVIKGRKKYPFDILKMKKVSKNLLENTLKITKDDDTIKLIKYALKNYEADKDSLYNMVKIKKDFKEEVVENPDLISDKLLELIFQTPITDIKKALVNLNYKGKIQTNKILLVQQLLQDFNTVEMMKKLIGAIDPTLTGAGFFDWVTEKASNAYDYVKQKYQDVKQEIADKGSAVLTRTNYVGPWNRLDDEYLRTHPPVDIIDEGAMKHDLEYSRIAKLRDDRKIGKEETDKLIRDSDIAFLDNIRKHWKVNPWASALGYAGIRNKNLLEDYADLDKNLFVGQGRQRRPKYNINEKNEVVDEEGNVFRMSVSPEEARRAQMTNEERALDHMKEMGNKMLNFYGLSGSGDDGYALHAVIFKKPYDLETAKKEAKKIINDDKKNFYRETETSYRFRAIPKTKFEKKSFRTKKVNNNISLIFGKLKYNYT